MKTLGERVEQAERAGPGEIRLLVHDPALEVLEALLGNPSFGEEHLLVLLNRKDLPRELLESVAGNEQLARSQRVKLALVEHPRTPRLISLKLLKFLHLFELVTVSLQPAVSAEIKRQAEDLIIGSLQQVPLGQQIALARRGTARVSAALLKLGNVPVIPAALDNPLLTEAALMEVLRQDQLPEAVPERIARHPKWSCRYDVRLQLLRHPLTPLGLALGFLPDLKPADLLLLTRDRRMAANLREYVEAEAERRLRRR
jgi:hypothetical protein